MSALLLYSKYIFGLVCNNLMSALLLYSKYIFGLDLLVSTFNFTMVTLNESELPGITIQFSLSSELCWLLSVLEWQLNQKDLLYPLQ